LMSINNRPLTRSGLLTHESASVMALRSARKRSWPPLVKSARKHTNCPTDGVLCFCALAFSTLLSSQGAGAHLRRALTLFQGNHSTLPGQVFRVNSVRQNFANP
jgi:hypothetical protein